MLKIVEAFFGEGDRREPEGGEATGEKPSAKENEYKRIS